VKRKGYDTKRKKDKMEQVAKDHKLDNRKEQFGVWITEDMTRRITYNHSTITYPPSGKPHSGDRVCVKAARRKESMCSDGSAGPESLA